MLIDDRPAHSHLHWAMVEIESRRRHTSRRAAAGGRAIHEEAPSLVRVHLGDRGGDSPGLEPGASSGNDTPAALFRQRSGARATGVSASAFRTEPGRQALRRAGAKPGVGSPPHGAGQSAQRCTCMARTQPRRSASALLGRASAPSPADRPRATSRRQVPRSDPSVRRLSQRRLPLHPLRPGRPRRRLDGVDQLLWTARPASPRPPRSGHRCVGTMESGSRRHR